MQSDLVARSRSLTIVGIYSSNADTENRSVSAHAFKLANKLAETMHTTMVQLLVSAWVAAGGGSVSATCICCAEYHMTSTCECHVHVPRISGQLDNTNLLHAQPSRAIYQVYVCRDATRWTLVDNHTQLYVPSSASLAQVQTLLQQQRQYEIHDFDSHLNSMTHDWTQQTMFE